MSFGGWRHASVVRTQVCWWSRGTWSVRWLRRSYGWASSSYPSCRSSFCPRWDCLLWVSCVSGSDVIGTNSATTGLPYNHRLFTHIYHRLMSIFDNVKCPRSKLSVLIIGLLACIIIVYQIGTVVKLLTRHAYEWMLFGYCSSNSVIVTVESFFRSLCSLSEWWAGVKHCGHNLYKRTRDTGNVLFFLHIIRL